MLFVWSKYLLGFQGSGSWRNRGKDEELLSAVLEPAVEVEGRMGTVVRTGY